MISHDQPPAQEDCRAEINRRNAQHSTGPCTAAGKSHSCQNAFKHGLYSKQLVQPGEDPAEFDELRSTLRREHEPANTTEEILVDELAQHFWRLRRFREIEARAWQPESDWLTTGMLAIINRALASAERGFFRALTALAKLQKARGFVPQKLQLKPELASAIEPETLVNDTAAPLQTPGNDAIHNEMHLPETHRSGPQRSPRSPQRIQKTPQTCLAL